ncbi:MAG: MTH938/NDUFAF3 family protein [Mariprofundus sp.]|nr:MTH938/NDUFAF3 family protein [Mariprofundus sp.]
MSPELEGSSLLFTGYENEALKVNHIAYHSSLCIHAGEMIAPWGPERLREVTLDDLQLFATHPPEVFIFGTGRLTAFPEASILQFFSELHIGYECMDSRSAARTYNILMAEGRTVSAAMLLPGSRR